MEIVRSVAKSSLAGARDKTRGDEQAVRGRALMLADSEVAVKSETRVGARLQRQSGIMARRGLGGGVQVVNESEQMEARWCRRCNGRLDGI
jgi:hypothetical protein